VSTSHPNHKLSYRPDIDGLRAIAVLVVVFFHAFPAWLPGGFVGVDVFFVISGFLISSLIFKDLKAGEFSLTDFYSRRIRRIFPALITVLASVLAIGWIVSFQEEFRLLCKHIAAGALFVSNVALYREDGYFDSISELKPLLHLWSLAIEEQFYILWPLTVALAYRWKKVAWLIIAVATGSFALNIWQVNTNPTAAFFLPFTRFWELMLGCALAYRAQNAHAKHNISGFAGLVLLGLGVVYCRKAGFPGLWALLPTVGACLLIHSGPSAWVNRKILSHPAMVGVGLISYPLYLWHWPLLSFARILYSEPPWTLLLSLVVLSVLLSWATYQWIEKTVRFSLRHQIPSFSLAGAMTVVVGLSGVSFARIHTQTNGGRDPASVGRGPCPDDLKSLKLEFCATSSASEPEIALLGDSHADHLFSGLSKLDRHSWLLLVTNSCPPVSGVEVANKHACMEQMTATIKYLTDRPHIKTVVLSFFSGYVHDTDFALNHKLTNGGPSETKITSVETDVKDKPSLIQYGLKKTVKTFLAAGKKVVVQMDIPELPFLPGDCVTRRLASGPRHAACDVPRADISIRQAPIRRILADLTQEFPQVRVVDPTDLFCDDKVCVARRGDEVLYRDSHHLNASGSLLVAPRLIEAIQN
jgi:peptidoglycan/LPS O-acetylase OafA/YrhL